MAIRMPAVAVPVCAAGSAFAAGAAAALSLGADCAVQDVAYARLKEVLLSGGQVIAAE